MTTATPLLPFRLPPPAPGPVDVLVVAGEHSGDEHGARLVRELRARHPGLVVAAIGGPELAAAGAQLLHDLTSTSVVGLVEVLKHYSFFKAVFDETVRWIAEHRPRAVCLIDYPGFNLRLAAELRKRGLSVKGGGSVRTLYYISPQIWAWKAKRRFTMARDLDAMAVIFPFEVACYADTTLPVEFVGHPFVAPDYTPPVKFDPAGPVLLLPGSRVQAVARIFPALLGGFAAHGGRDAVVLYPSAEILRVLQAARPPAKVRLAPTGETVAASAVLTSSGTMSMHCALAGIPGAIAYRTNPLTYLLGRMLVKVEYIGIANLLLREPMYPEYIQGAATPAALAGELRACLTEPSRRERTAAQAAKLRGLLSQPAGGTAADWLARQLGAAAG
ncbi:MAG TPA: lipid-A-disaccharide synthase [Opitutaceae bacterium]|nr:lipid-A-disaccharide synthase [Opitutaceae bacterium]